MKQWALLAPVSACAAILLSGVNAQTRPKRSEVWTFDRLDKIGGHQVTVLGHPRVIQSPLGKVVQFNGVDDALFLETHPLAGVETFTWEVIFRPELGGKPEQRFFHLQEKDAKTGADTQTRMLFETRLIGDTWCLDSFVRSDKGQQALMNKQRLHPLDAWYHVAMVYDGKEFRNYVNGEQEGAAAVQFSPQAPGRTSAGVRINKVDYFKGSIRSARFTPRALRLEEFLKLPRQAGATRK